MNFGQINAQITSQSLWDPRERVTGKRVDLAPDLTDPEAGALRFAYVKAKWGGCWRTGTARSCSSCSTGRGTTKRVRSALRR